MKSFPGDADMVRKFLLLQNGLVRAYLRQHPEIKDFKFFTDFPRSGKVLLNEESWDFHKHGAGVKFIRNFPPNIVVDIHRLFMQADFLDEWRLEQYVISLGLSAEGLSSYIDYLVEKGLIARCESGYVATKALTA